MLHRHPIVSVAESDGAWVALDDEGVLIEGVRGSTDMDAMRAVQDRLLSGHSLRFLDL